MSDVADRSRNSLKSLIPNTERGSRRQHEHKC